MPEDDAEATDDEQDAQVTAVVDGSGKDAHDEEHEGLDGADPGYIGRGSREELSGLVVGLENAKGVEDAPCVEPQHEGAEDVEPGGQSAVGGWGCGAGGGFGGGFTLDFGLRVEGRWFGGDGEGMFFLVVHCLFGTAG